MHVHTSARLLTYMRVSEGASVPERARIIFIFLDKKFSKIFVHNGGLTSGTGFLAMREVILASPVILPYGSYICLTASDIAHYVRSCGESEFLSFRHFVPPPSSDGGFFRREQAHRPTN